MRELLKSKLTSGLFLFANANCRRRRELNMPPLSNLNISRNQTPVHAAGNFGGAPQTYNQPAEAAIQSWAGSGEGVQQPQPMQPPANPSMWNPSMGISFGGPPSSGQGQDGPGTWKPGSGIRFG